MQVLRPSTAFSAMFVLLLFLPARVATSASIVDIVRKGKVKELEAAIAKKVDLDKQKEGGTALMVAADRGDSVAVRMLLGGGANPNLSSTSRNERGSTALMYAAARGHVGIARELLAHGADVHMQRWATAVSLHHVMGVAGDTVNFIHDMLVSLPDSVVLESNFPVSISSARSMGSAWVPSVFFDLLDKRQKEKNRAEALPIPSALGSTVAGIHTLARAEAPCGRYLDSLRILLDRSFWIVQLHDGNSALTLAVLAGHIDMVKLLLAAGARPERMLLWETTRFYPGDVGSLAGGFSRPRADTDVDVTMVTVPDASAYPPALGSAIQIARHLRSQQLLDLLEAARASHNHD